MVERYSTISLAGTNRFLQSDCFAWWLSIALCARIYYQLVNWMRPLEKLQRRLRYETWANCHLNELFLRLFWRLLAFCRRFTLRVCTRALVCGTATHTFIQALLNNEPNQLFQFSAPMQRGIFISHSECERKGAAFLTPPQTLTYSICVNMQFEFY